MNYKYEVKVMCIEPLVRTICAAQAAFYAFETTAATTVHASQPDLIVQCIL